MLPEVGVLLTLLLTISIALFKLLFELLSKCDKISVQNKLPSLHLPGPQEPHRSRKSADYSSFSELVFALNM